MSNPIVFCVVFTLTFIAALFEIVTGGIFTSPFKLVCVIIVVPTWLFFAFVFGCVAWDQRRELLRRLWKVLTKPIA